MNRLRVVLVLLLLGAWFLRWTATRQATVAGPERTGAVAAAALFLLWGLALTVLVARSERGVRRGLALTDAGLAALAGALLFASHPWIAGGPIRPVFAVVFVPLALLALLDALVPGRDGEGDDVVLFLRMVAAIVAGALVLAKGAPWPGTLLLALALGPALTLLTSRSPFGARWGAGILLLAASVAAFFAPEIHEALGGVPRATGIYEGRFAWQVVAAGLALLSLAQVLWPKRVDGKRP